MGFNVKLKPSQTPFPLFTENQRGFQSSATIFQRHANQKSVTEVVTDGANAQLRVLHESDTISADTRLVRRSARWRARRCLLV